MSNASDFIIENGVLIKYNGKDSAIVIPAVATEIGAEAFTGKKKITEITVPGAVAKIGHNAFKGCSTLGKVEIQNSEAEAYDCFSGCKALTYISASEKTMEGIFRFCSTKMKIRLCYGYLNTNDVNRVYEDNAKRLKKHLIAQAVEENCAAAIAKLFACYKKPIAINELDDYLTDASEKTSVTVFLLEYKAKHYSAEKVEKHAQDNEDKALGLKEKTLAEWRKVFALSSGVEIIIERYKGKDEVVCIPAQIEGKPVVTIGAGAFERRNEITDITIPANVTTIAWFAFDDCTNMTIHAPAGSYAEQYAKENNIPFDAI